MLAVMLQTLAVPLSAIYCVNDALNIFCIREIPDLVDLVKVYLPFYLQSDAHNEFHRF